MAREHARRRVLVAVGVLVVLAAVVAAAIALTSRDGGVGSETPESASSRPASPDASSLSAFPAFWPASTFQEAAGLQVAAEAGRDEWMKDPKEVAGRLVASFAGWGDRVTLDGNSFESGLDISDPEITGSSGTGWTATVTFTRYRVVEGRRSPIGGKDTVSMMGLQGSAEPVWFVTALRASQVQVDEPRDGASVGSPLTLAGQGVGFEGTIVTEVRDDDGASLGKGFVNAGAMEMGPFSGTLGFEAKGASSGVVVLSSAQGADGPPLAVSIVRLHFQSA